MGSSKGRAGIRKEGEGPQGPRSAFSVWGGERRGPKKGRSVGSWGGGGEEGVRRGKTRAGGPVLPEGLQAKEALAGSRGVSSREAAESSSEPTSPARPPAPLPLRAATSRLPSHRLPREGARPPGVLSGTPAPPCPRAGLSPPGPLPRVRTRAAARSPRRRTPSPD